jgi:hypothetical protein
MKRKNKKQLTLRIDRTKIDAGLLRPPDIPGFRIVADTRILPQTDVATYGRVRTLINDDTGTRAFMLYERKLPRLPHLRVTIIPKDRPGLVYKEARIIADAIPDYRLNLVELAFDFDESAGIDKVFIEYHALFGKSRPAFDRQYPNATRLGTRQSRKLVRAYPKPEIGFRVEVESHRALLQDAGIFHFEDLDRLPAILFPKHFRFVKVAWSPLRAYLAKRYPNSTQFKSAIAQAKRHRRSIHLFLRFLRSELRVNNPHRLLSHSGKNGIIADAIERFRWVDSSAAPHPHSRFGPYFAANDQSQTSELLPAPLIESIGDDK